MRRELDFGVGTKIAGYSMFPILLFVPINRVNGLSTEDLSHSTAVVLL